MSISDCSLRIIMPKRPCEVYEPNSIGNSVRVAEGAVVMNGCSHSIDGGKLTIEKVHSIITDC